MATLSFITSANSSGTATSRTGTFTPTAVGQLIVLGCLSLTGGNIIMKGSDDAGNIYNQIFSTTSGPSVGLWWATATSTALTTYTVSISASVAATSFIGVYSSTSGTYTIDGPCAWDQQTSATPAGGNVNSTFGTSWVVSMIVNAGGFSNPAGYTTRSTSVNVAGRIVDSNGGLAIGSYNPAWSTTSSAWGVINFAISPEILPMRTTANVNWITG